MEQNQTDLLHGSKICLWAYYLPPLHLSTDQELKLIDSGLFLNNVDKCSWGMLVMFSFCSRELSSGYASALHTIHIQYNSKVSSIRPSARLPFEESHSHNFQITDGIAMRNNNIFGHLSKKHYYFQKFIFIL